MHGPIKRVGLKKIESIFQPIPITSEANWTHPNGITAARCMNNALKICIHLVLPYIGFTPIHNALLA